MLGAPAVIAEPELKGSPEQLRSFLHPRTRTVNLNADAEMKAYTDRVIASVTVTTEHAELAESMAANSRLRAEISRRLIEAMQSKLEIESRPGEGSRFFFTLPIDEQNRAGFDWNPPRAVRAARIRPRARPGTPTWS